MPVYFNNFLNPNNGYLKQDNLQKIKDIVYIYFILINSLFQEFYVAVVEDCSGAKNKGAVSFDIDWSNFGRTGEKVMEFFGKVWKKLKIFEKNLTC